MTMRITKLPKASSQSKPRLTKQMVKENLALQAWHLQAIRQGIAEADVGKLLPHEEAVKRLRMFGKRHLK